MRKTAQSRCSLSTRAQRKQSDIDVNLEGFDPASIIDDKVIAHGDINVTNTADAQDNVAPADAADAKISGSGIKASIAPLSYRFIRIRLN